MSVNHNLEQWIAQLDYDDTCDISDKQVADLIRNYAELEQKLAESQREFRAADATIENLQMQVEKLAAENAGLKAAFIPEEIPEEAVYALQNTAEFDLDSNDTGSWQWIENDTDVIRAVLDALKPETPATDAFLAEVRAQVWIEGNEPAEFGRYWVRYETDVGPQYCSAKWMEHNFCAGSDTNIHKIWLADHSRSINSLKGVTHYTMLPELIEGGSK